MLKFSFIHTKILFKLFSIIIITSMSFYVRKIIRYLNLLLIGGYNRKKFIKLSWNHKNSYHVNRKKRKYLITTQNLKKKRIIDKFNLITIYFFWILIIYIFSIYSKNYLSCLNLIFYIYFLLILIWKLFIINILLSLQKTTKIF